VEILVVSNPKSGRGKARTLAHTLVEAIAQRGHQAAHLLAGGADQLDAERLASAAALVIAGGDGTVLRCAEAASQARCPLYHIPTGNENLFAREFGMTSSVSQLLRAIDAQRIARVDLGRLRRPAGVEPFLLMFSVGPDAGVIRRLSRTRKRAVGHAAYVRPIIGETLTPLIARLSIDVDGRRVVDERRGWVIVSNCRHYALRINPARSARMDDGQLDVVFMPASSSLRAMLWMTRCALNADLARRGGVVARGRTVRVQARTERHPACYQVDGEAPSLELRNLNTIELESWLESAQVPVLLPV